ncbi:MAG: imidazoleglycerol-phosphate dehydratase HisB [Armatimonadota bacterium]|nr:MAG: imidazoleglycerol-phosphate dehydratase HisB [Armatimonadota bacterium]
MRKADVQRKTKETSISLRLILDGRGAGRIDTGIGFLDHMLELLARHAGFDLTVKAAGDVHVDDHHLVEDVGIVLGDAIQKGLGKKEGIARYGWAAVPMDESLVLCAVDLSGRPYLSYGLKLRAKRIKKFETELIEEFLRAVANSAAMNLHLAQLAGGNTHHIIEAAFKAFARALGQAVQVSSRVRGVPSTKGVL